MPTMEGSSGREGGKARDEQLVARGRKNKLHFPVGLHTASHHEQQQRCWHPRKRGDPVQLQSRRLPRDRYTVEQSRDVPSTTPRRDPSHCRRIPVDEAHVSSPSRGSLPSSRSRRAIHSSSTA